MSKTTDDTDDTSQLDPMDDSQGHPHPTPPPTITSKKRKCRKEVIQPMEKPMKVITFIVNIMACTELKKLIAKIDQILSLKKIGIEDYEVTFYIPHILPKLGLPLVSEEHYRTLSNQIDKIASQNPTINIIVLQKPAMAVVKEVPANSSTQGDEEPDAGGSGMSRGNKKKKDAMELPGNIHLSKNIQLLCDAWLCKKPDSACPSTHCYVTTSDEHFPLSHEHFNCWAATMLKGTEHAMITKPPNHCLFNAVDTRGNITQEKLSLVLQHHLALESKNNPLQISSPVINVTLGNDILGLAHTSMGPQIQMPQHKIETTNDSLLPMTHVPGEDMAIIEFCTHYNLGDTILKKLQDNSFRKACSLHFLTINALKEMDFVHGEIVELQDAVEQWSTLVRN
ncbi:hypothetical protein BKA83DRAFT_4495901 [Pisolithus microcarpus]|nr:hypothetical protein BKA83DRAFT_4495901 [Pisolithus microcarpus]